MIESDVLLRVPLFQRLNAGALRELAARSTPRTFPADEVPWNAGTEPRGFFVGRCARGGGGVNGGLRETGYR